MSRGIIKTLMNEEHQKKKFLGEQKG